jgi:hypothetical protein
MVIFAASRPMRGVSALLVDHRAMTAPAPHLSMLVCVSAPFRHAFGALAGQGALRRLS